MTELVTAIDYYAEHPVDEMRCLRDATGARAIARYLVLDPDHDPRRTEKAEREAAESLGMVELYWFEMDPTYADYFTPARAERDVAAAMAGLDRMGEPRSRFCARCQLFHGPVVRFAVDAPPSTIPPEALDPYWNRIEDLLDEEARVDRRADPLAFTSWRLFDGMYGFQGHIERALERFTIARRHLAQTYGDPALARARLESGELELWQHEQRTECGIDIDLDLIDERALPSKKEDDMAITRDDYIAVDPATGMSLEDLVKATDRVLWVAEFNAAVQAEIAAAKAATTNAAISEALAIVSGAFSAAASKLIPPAPRAGLTYVGESTDGSATIWADDSGVNHFYKDGQEVTP
jgi:hypothetical protein